MNYILHRVAIDWKKIFTNQNAVVVKKVISFSHTESASMQKKHFHSYYQQSPLKKYSGNFKKILEMLGFDGKYLAGQPKVKF